MAKKPNYHAQNHVIEMKLHGVDTTFSQSYEEHFQVLRGLFNELPMYGMDSLEFRNEAGEIQTMDLKTKRLERYNLTNKSMSYSNFESALLFIFNTFKFSSRSRTLYSSILGIPEEDKQAPLTPSDFKQIQHINDSLKNSTLESFKKDKKAAKEAGEDTPDIFAQNALIYRIGNALRLMGFRSPEFYNINLSTGEKYSVVEMARRSLQTWFGNDLLTRTAYAEAKSTRDILFQSLPEDMQPDLASFVALCIGDTDGNIYLSHFDSRVPSHIEDCLAVSFNAGSGVPSNKFYLNEQGEEEPFSLNPTLEQFLLKHPTLWEASLYAPFLEAAFDLVGRRPCAAFPFIAKNAYHRSHYILGGNFSSFSLKDPNENNTLQDVVFDGETFKGGCKISDLRLSVYKGENRLGSKSRGANSFYQFKVALQKTRYGKGAGITLAPNAYFDNLRIWSKDNTHLMRWTRRGVEQTALLKEPAIVYKDGKYYLRMSFTVCMGDRAFADKVIATQAFFSSALPQAKTSRSKGTSSGDKHLPVIKGETFRILGVDLGLNHPFAYSVMEAHLGDQLSTPVQVASGLVSRNEDPVYQNLLLDFQRVSKLYSMTKYRSTVDPKKVNKDTKVVLLNAQNYFAVNPKVSKLAHLYQEFSQFSDPLQVFVDQVNSTPDKSTLKDSPEFILNILVKYLDYRMGEINDSRRNFFAINKDIRSTSKEMKARTQIFTKFENDNIYLKLLEATKRVRKAQTMLGTVQKKGGPRMTTLTLNAQMTLLKKNYLRQMASQIVARAVEHGCQIIAMEDLGNFSAKALKSRKTNEMLSMWSPKAIQEAVINAANWSAIPVVFVTESLTSKVHFDTQTFGFRPSPRECFVAKSEKGWELACYQKVKSKDEPKRAFDTSLLYYLDEEGNPQSTCADKNAAANIAHRALTRHADLRSFKGKFFDKPDFLRVGGWLTRLHGSIAAAKDAVAHVPDFKTSKGRVNNLRYLLDDGSWGNLGDYQKAVDRVRQAHLERLGSKI